MPFISVLDISIVSSDVLVKFHSEPDTWGSDHFQIRLVLPYRTPPRLKRYRAVARRGACSDSRAQRHLPNARGETHVRNARANRAKHRSRDNQIVDRAIVNYVTT